MNCVFYIQYIKYSVCICNLSSLYNLVLFIIIVHIVCISSEWFMCNEEKKQILLL
jgi:hypothetical protein